MAEEQELMGVPKGEDASKWEIPYYRGDYKGIKGYSKSLAQLAYQAGIGGDDPKGFQEFVKTDPRAQQVVAAANRAGYGNELYRAFEFGNHFIKNEIIPEVARQQQADATKKSFTRAEDYSRNLGQTIQDETSALRSSLATQLAEARGNIKQQENSRGMLYSGQRQKKEGMAQNLAGKQFAEGAGQIVQGAEQTKADLYGQASALRQGQMNASQAAQGIVDRAKEARQSAASALQSQYSSLLGQGIGTYAGGLGGNKLTTNNQYTLGAQNVIPKGQMTA